MQTTYRMNDPFTLGGRAPRPVGLLIIATVVISLAAAFITRRGIDLASLAALAPERVWRGEVWRLLSWPFVERSPLGLLFSCLLFYWFGRDLVRVWGERRFLGIYLGLALVTGALTSLLGRLDPDIMRQSYLGNWALAEALVLAWGLLYPQRTLHIYFVLPVTGRAMAYLIIGLTVAFAIYSGWEGYIPNLVAGAAMIAHVYRRQLRARWLALRLARQQGATRSGPARGGDLYEIGKGGGDRREPPKKWMN